MYVYVCVYVCVGVCVCVCVCEALNPEGSRSESPQSSTSRLLRLWAETVPGPQSPIAEVQTDSSLIQSGTFTETLSASLTLSHVAK